MDEIKKSTEEIQKLIEVVSAGVATEEQIGTLCRTLQINLSTNLITAMSQSLQGINKLASIRDRVLDRVLELTDDPLYIQNLSVNEGLSLIEFIQSSEVKLLDLQRKIVQGKELFPEMVMSEDEKKVIKLLNSFKTPKEKLDFINLVVTTLEPLSNEPEQ